MKIEKRFEYSELSDPSDLNSEQLELLQHAKDHISNSYSPYSKFKVSASLQLENGEIINGTNQENAAYPSGLCAERVGFFYSGSRYPNVKIVRVAITASSEKHQVDHPISPCGACRQAMLEYELEQNSDIEVILQGESGSIILINKIKDLMPLFFFEKHLKE